jgi:hypothetical protein
MTDKVKTQDEQTRSIEQLLRNCGFAEVECYRRPGYDFLRVRVVDQQFAGLGYTARMDRLESDLAKLPEDVQGLITMLVVVTPDERETVPLSREFDQLDDDDDVPAEAIRPLLTALRLVATDYNFWKLSEDAKNEVRNALRPYEKVKG